MNVGAAVLRLLKKNEKRSALLVGGLATLSAVFEAISVVSIVPFLSVAADPEIVTGDGTIAKVYAYTGAGSFSEFLILLGIVSFCLIVSAALVRTFSEYHVTRFVQLRRHSIATYLLAFYLRQPYEFFITRHTSDLAKEILSEVDAIVMSVIQPASAIITNVISLLILTTLLVVVDPVVAVTAGGFLLIVYFLVFRFLKPVVARAGVMRRQANKERFEALSEALSGIKMIKLYGNEKLYMGRFSAPSRVMSEAIMRSTISGRMPKYIVEAVGFGLIILLTLALIMREPESSAANSALLPMLGLYGFCGYRMLPAIQGIYLAVTQIRFGIEPLKNMVAEVEAAEAAPSEDRKAIDRDSQLPFERSIRFDNVCYLYPGSENHGIADVSLTIARGTSIGIVGETGAGKTTFIDLFLGLLVPSAGNILCDDVAISARNRSVWQAKVGYVPQEILLMNSSIRENIAFGLKADEIDQERVIECARIAQIHEFIVGELPQGYETSVGERGIRLSGGQRQRIGIARALYADPSVLVLDEATSALDTRTEARVMAGIREMGKSKTVLIVAHRHSTLKSCDQVVQLENGRIARVGDFGTILAGTESAEQQAGSNEA